MGKPTVNQLVTYGWQSWIQGIHRDFGDDHPDPSEGRGGTQREMAEQAVEEHGPPSVLDRNDDDYLAGLRKHVRIGCIRNGRLDALSLVPVTSRVAGLHIF